MSKYSNEFKLEVVQYYLKGKTSYPETAKHFNLSDWTSIQRWVRKYQIHGPKGLIKALKSSYSGEFKQNVVEYMHKNHLSLKETAIQFNLGNLNVVQKWECIYYEEGPQALYEERRGRKKNMNSKSNRKKSRKSQKSNEDLIAEIEQLKMENAYLKKLQALVQERTKPKQSKKW